MTFALRGTGMAPKWEPLAVAQSCSARNYVRVLPKKLGQTYFKNSLSAEE